MQQIAEERRLSAIALGGGDVPALSAPLTLVSHYLCPYVQRAAIALNEKGIAHERVYIDLANKPDWFLELSPLGMTPVLQVGDRAIFESAVILELLEETQGPGLHPDDPLARADHRAWMEVGSAILNDIAGFYSAPDQAAFEAKAAALRVKFERLEQRLAAEPWFDGSDFSLVDVVFAPVFRYFDVFDRVADFGILKDLPKIERWREALSQRPSVVSAVTEDYEERLLDFLSSKSSYLGSFVDLGE